MSTHTSRSPSAAESRWGISADELKRRERMHVEPAQEDERRCHDCGLRVTITDNGEVGHARGRKKPLCPHYSGPHAERDRTADKQETLSDY